MLFRSDPLTLVVRYSRGSRLLPSTRTPKAGLTVHSTKASHTRLVLTVNPAFGVRVLGSNLDPREYLTTNVNGSTNVATQANERTTSQSFSGSYINWQLRLEMKL